MALSLTLVFLDNTEFCASVPFAVPLAIEVFVGRYNWAKNKQCLRLGHGVAQNPDVLTYLIKGLENIMRLATSENKVGKIWFLSFVLLTI